MSESPCPCMGCKRAYKKGRLDAADEVLAYAEERLTKTGHPNRSEDITAALRVAASQIKEATK